MARSVQRRLHPTELAESATAVFGDPDVLLSEYAMRFDLGALCETHVFQLSQMRSTLEDLPDHAFAAQPDDFDGGDVWAAGQIVSHLAEMFVLAAPFWEALVGYRLEPPANDVLNAVDARLLPRDGAIRCVVAAQKANAELVEALRTSPPGRHMATHFVLGMTNAHGAMLGTCIHTQDHLGQLSELGQADGPS